MDMVQKRKFSLKQYSMVFQAQVHAIKALTDNKDRAIKIGTTIFYQRVRQGLKC
jgi:hypothetical protein